MTDAQEAILDYLMAQPIGERWDTGPVGRALKALRSAPGFKGRRISQTLGFPRGLCHALAAASAALESEEDRRKLAVSFFTALAPRNKASRRSPQQEVAATLWCGQYAHALVCRPDCPYLTETERCVRAYLQDPQHGPAAFPAGLRCPAIVTRETGADANGVSPELNAQQALACAYNAAFLAAGGHWLGHEGIEAARLAAGVAARVNGVAGAIDFCVSLARQLGLTS